MLTLGFSIALIISLSLAFGVAPPEWRSLVGFAILMLFATSAVAALQLARDTIPSDFSLAEKVKYRLDRIARWTREYEAVFDDEKGRRAATRHCRQQSVRLLAAVSRYTQQGSPTEQIERLDLFTGDLQDFSSRIIELARRLSGLVKQDKRLSTTLVSCMEDLAARIEEEPLKFGSAHGAAIDFALRSAKGSGEEIDESLGARAQVLMTKWVSFKFHQMRPIARLFTIIIVTSVFFWSLVLAIPALSSLSPEAKAASFFGTLTVALSSWFGMRK